MDRLKVEKDYEILVTKLIEKKITVSTMESCTGGQIASLITNVSGSSEILTGAFVTYSNKAKIMQGVPASVINIYGVYSLETAEAMAATCKRAYKANMGIGITGSIGRVDPANPDSVAGEVYYSVLYKKRKISRKMILPDNADRINSKYIIAEEIAKDIDEILETKQKP